MARQYSSRVSPKGQITLPADVRKELGIKPRDSVSIEVGRGVLRIKPKARLRDFHQISPALEPERSWQEIERVAHEDHADRAARRR